MKNTGISPSPDFHQRLEEFQTTADAILLDVRSVKEYQDGHLPGSMNVPLKELDQISGIISLTKTTHILSGLRKVHRVPHLPDW